ncbi:adhesion G protein-coupled receptor G3-like [Ctenopharyngodon idella]|uniref:adhesion G protein-coupled receptor G3-like n=1 Tax=Ctenopharyngodon idella TaxID=7959 RepID=UPI00222FA78F|nr:adhesion G protein-coupled receptor G3-like [Ctenopharyngodon idella]
MMNKVDVINIDERQWEILSYISYIGCGLSAFFSASSVLSFIFNRCCFLYINACIICALIHIILNTDTKSMHINSSKPKIYLQWNYSKLLTISACAFLRKSRAEVSSSIHVSLSGALFLLNISFMLSEWAATLTEKKFCVFIAVMIHYSLLSCFTWMAVEALHLYLLLIRVFNIYVKYYMAKLSLIGWGEYNNI